MEEKETKLDAYGVLDVEKQIWDGKTPIKWEMTANTGHLCVPGPYCLSSFKEIENGKIYINKNGTRHFLSNEELIEYQKLRKQDSPSSPYQLKFNVTEKEMNEEEKTFKLIKENRLKYQNNKNDPKFHYNSILQHMKSYASIHPSAIAYQFYLNEDQAPLKKEINKLFSDNGFKIDMSLSDNSSYTSISLTDLIIKNNYSEQAPSVSLPEQIRQRAKEKLQSYKDSIVQDTYNNIIKNEIPNAIENNPTNLNHIITMRRPYLSSEEILKVATDVSLMLEKDGFNTIIIPAYNCYCDMLVSWSETKDNYKGRAYIENPSYFLILPQKYNKNMNYVSNLDGVTYKLFTHQQENGHIRYWFKDIKSNMLPQTYENLILFQKMFGGEIVPLEELAHHPPATKKEEKDERQVETKDYPAAPTPSVVLEKTENIIKKEEGSMLPILLAGAGVSALSYFSKGKVSLKKNEVI
jgi:hypothetical protein